MFECCMKSVHYLNKCSVPRLFLASAGEAIDFLVFAVREWCTLIGVCSVNRRYLRHFGLFGKEGQYALLDAKVAVIGSGGLGCSVLYNLAAAGLGEIVIVDFDRVSESDLNRQFLFENSSVQQLKVYAAKRRLNAFNPDCKIFCYPMRIQDCSEVIEGCEVVVDCTDDFKTRFYLNELCFLKRKALISAGVTGYSGYVIVLKPFVSDDSPCYRCFCPGEPEACFKGSCEDGGVIGAAVSTIGSIQAMKVIQEILHINPEKAGKLIFCDILNNRFRSAIIMRDPYCNVCGQRCS
ncbi:HesA/MoeB/ThiF family protein [Neorickettsia risticii]